MASIRVFAVLGAFLLGGAGAIAQNNDLTAIPGSFKATTDVDTGEYSSPNMSVEVVLASRDETGLSNLLREVYDANGPSYRHWLGSDEFYARFAPSREQTAEIENHLRANGLTVEQSSSPFLVRASGSSPAVEAAFATTLHTYRNARGIAYYSNASTVHLPASINSGVLGVVGLSNSVRLRSHVARPLTQASPSASCETPYPTRAQLSNFLANQTPFPFGYGGGPGCNGLTPSQVNSLYNAPDLGPRGRGAGVNLAVFELSAYQHFDIATWAHMFYGAAYTPPLVDITVDGGPLNPICPSNDVCPPQYNGYNGDVEVDADIEMQLAISPDASHILVYNAPNDYTGQTELDEYTRIARDNRADVISSSWGECENDAGAGYVRAENLIFEQMALQGQSMFGAEGDTGAFGCIRSDGTTILNVLDPPAQPWVTSVGGTSFVSDNPGRNPNPKYPTGSETVWNVDDLCNESADERGFAGLTWCEETGAGGGGNSQYWGRPFYQFGPGVTNSYTTYGNETTHCSLAAAGTPCREVPDVSANADEYTPYAEYCTGSDATPYSTCGTFSSLQTPPGWFGIGGTSLSSPLWSAIVADHDSFWGHRIGNANPLLYGLFNLDHWEYFHAIRGKGQKTNNNGYFPAAPGYDMATGVGTPDMGSLIPLPF